MSVAAALAPRPGRRVGSGGFVALTAGGAALVGTAAHMGPVPATAAAGAAVGAYAVLTRPIYGVYFLASVAPIVSGLHRGLPVPGFRLSELAIVLVGTLVLWATRDRAPTRWRALDWCALAYATTTLVIGAVAVLRGGGAFDNESLGTLLGPLQFLVLYRVVIAAVNTWEEWRRVLRLLLYASVPVSALAILQWLGAPGIRSFLLSATGSQAGTGGIGGGFTRVTGPFPHWQPLAAYLFLVLVVGVALLFTQRQQVIGRRSLVIVLAPALVALVQTATLGPLLGAVVAAAVLAIWSGADIGRVLRWLVGVAATVGIFFGPLLNARLDQQFNATASNAWNPSFPQTLQFRWVVWTDQYLPALWGHWLLGYGPALPSSITWRFTESIYVSLLMRGGLMLLVAYLALMWALLRAAGRAAVARDPDRQVIGRALVVATAVLFILQTLQAYFLQTGMSHDLWILAALLAATAAGTPLSTGLHAKGVR